MINYENTSKIYCHSFFDTKFNHSHFSYNQSSFVDNRNIQKKHLLNISRSRQQISGLQSEFNILQGNANFFVLIVFALKTLKTYFNGTFIYKIFFMNAQVWLKKHIGQLWNRKHQISEDRKRPRPGKSNRKPSRNQFVPLHMLISKKYQKY